MTNSGKTDISFVVDCRTDVSSSVGIFLLLYHVFLLVKGETNPSMVLSKDYIGAGPTHLEQTKVRIPHENLMTQFQMSFEKRESKLFRQFNK